MGDAKQLELRLVNPDHPPRCLQSRAHRRFQRGRELCMFFENKWRWGGVGSGQRVLGGIAGGNRGLGE